MLHMCGFCSRQNLRAGKLCPLQLQPPSKQLIVSWLVLPLGNSTGPFTGHASCITSSRNRRVTRTQPTSKTSSQGTAVTSLSVDALMVRALPSEVKTPPHSSDGRQLRGELRKLRPGLLPCNRRLEAASGLFPSRPSTPAQAPAGIGHLEADAMRELPCLLVQTRMPSFIGESCPAPQHIILPMNAGRQTVPLSSQKGRSIEPCPRPWE